MRAKDAEHGGRQRRVGCRHVPSRVKLACAIAVTCFGLCTGGLRGQTPVPAPPATPQVTYALDATWPATLTGLREPLGLAVGSDGRVVVLDSQPERVVVLDGNGSVDWVWHDTDPPDDGYWEDEGPIAALGAPSGDLLVLRRLGRILRDSIESQSRELSRYARGGAVLWRSRQLGVDVTLDPSHPDRIWFDRFALSEDGERVYVLDRGAPRVSAKAADSGRNLGIENLPPAESRRLVDTFDWYADIDVLADGRLALINQAQSALVLVRSQWSPPRAPSTRTITVPGRPHRLAADRLGHVFVLDVSGWVRKLDVAGRTLAAFDGRGDRPAPRSTIADVAVTPDGAVLTLDSRSATVRRFVPVAVGSGPRDAPELYCALTPSKSAHPGRVFVADPVTVTLSVAGTCPRVAGTDVILQLSRGVGDGARSMELDVARPVARAFVERADLDRVRVGITSHTLAFTPTLEAALGADRSTLLAVLDGIRPDRLEPPYGLRQRVYAHAQAELDGPNGRAAAHKILVAFTAPGQPGISVMDSLSVRAQGTRLVSVVALDARAPLALYVRDESRLWPRFLATGWWDYYPAGRLTAANGAELYDALVADSPPRDASHLAATLVVTDRVPVDMTYVEGSARPPATWDPATRILTWRGTDVTFGGARMTYVVRPTLAGLRPTNVEAGAAYVDGLGVGGTLWFPVPEIEVVAPTSTPSRTATPSPSGSPTPSPTPTPTPTPVPTASATPAPTAAATPVPSPVYMPLALRERCAPDERRVDVVLTIDASSSMEFPSGDGRTKLAAALDATRAFLDAVRLDAGDQAAIVGFNAEATLREPLTRDRTRLHDALTSIRTGPQTCLVCALEVAWTELQSSRHVAGHVPVVLLLTDGRSNPRPVEQAVAQAAAAKAGGARIVAIGLGEDLDFDALGRIASEPDDFYHLPDAETLVDIYRRVAVDLRCPAHRFWGRR